MRKLASVQEIKSLYPIPNADRIEVATVNGWEVVVEKGLHEVGDKVVYCEIDSFLPVRPELEFLRKSSFKNMDGKEGFRLRTIKLRGQVSQGLVLPLSILDGAKVGSEGEIYGEEVPLSSIPVGTDVTDPLGIVKYEKPEPVTMGGQTKGNFPWFLNKTDEERVQNINTLHNLWHLDFHYTEKLDGTSFTAYFFEGEFGVCSRNLDLKEDEDNLYWKVARIYDIEDYISHMGLDIAVQGEIVGPGLQGNPYKLNEHKLYIFNVWDIANRSYFTSRKAQELVEEMDLDYVPIISPDEILEEQKDIMEINPIAGFLDIANRKSKINPESDAEGIVVVVEGLSSKRFSFKAISNNYLLNEKD